MKKNIIMSFGISRRATQKKVVFTIVAVVTFLSLIYEESMIQTLTKAAQRRLSLNLGEGECEWRPAIQYDDTGFPSDQSFLKTIVAGYPSGDKRLVFTQLEGKSRPPKYNYHVQYYTSSRIST